MKKIFICAAFALLTFASCKKDLSTNTGDRQPAVTSNATLASSTSHADAIVRIDLTGQPAIENPCTGEPLTFLSGILQLNIAPDGQSIRSTTVSNLVVQDAAGTIYHGVLAVTFEQKGSISQGTFSFTLTYILNSQGGGDHIRLHETFIIVINANGVLTVGFDKVTVDCH
jgi:hypothetical protein